VAHAFDFSQKAFGTHSLRPTGCHADSPPGEAIIRHLATRRPGKAMIYRAVMILENPHCLLLENPERDNQEHCRSSRWWLTLELPRA
jgi:hypothetical protein